MEGKGQVKIGMPTGLGSRGDKLVEAPVTRVELGDLVRFSWHLFWTQDSLREARHDGLDAVVKVRASAEALEGFRSYRKRRHSYRFESPEGTFTTVKVTQPEARLWHVALPTVVGTVAFLGAYCLYASAVFRAVAGIFASVLA